MLQTDCGQPGVGEKENLEQHENTSWNLQLRTNKE